MHQVLRHARSGSLANAREVLIAIGLLVMLCTSREAGAREAYQFEYDFTRDDQHCVIIKYRLYSGEHLIAGKSPEDFANFKGLYGESIGGLSPRPTTLYVQWQDKSNGETHEDKVSLEKRLPRDMSDKIIALMIYGSHLYIFVSSPQPNVPGSPVIGPSINKHLQTVQIYPDEPMKQRH